MPNFASGAEQRHFFGGNLPGAQERDRFRPVLAFECA